MRTEEFPIHCACGSTWYSFDDTGKIACAAGTSLTRILSRLGITKATGCGCVDLAREMDRRGCQWCEEHADELAARLMDNQAKVAKRRSRDGSVARLSGLVAGFIGTAAGDDLGAYRRLVILAIQEARKHANITESEVSHAN